jgi:citrate/tricarballylate utilization protein
MQASELTREGARVMSVCNACRYCEQYCPVFEAMERRLTFASADLRYLANLCHNCGECLYACQYAPPHEFAIDVPKTFARIRVRSYEEYAWPAALGAAFARQNVRTALLLAALMIGVLGGAVLAANPGALRNPGANADFYAVVPHAVMVALFGGVGLFVAIALAIGVARCRRDIASTSGAIGRDRRDGRGRGVGAMLRAVLTLRHLHAAGADCTTARETRTPWRRRWHHAVFYGFLLCFASTSVAALYHALGSRAV